MSRVTGLLREIVMARLFGAGFVYDAFLLGFRLFQRGKLAFWDYA